MNLTNVTNTTSVGGSNLANTKEVEDVEVEFTGHFESEYHYQCKKSHLIVVIHTFINFIYFSLLLYLIRI